MGWILRRWKENETGDQLRIVHCAMRYRQLSMADPSIEATMVASNTWPFYLARIA